MIKILLFLLSITMAFCLNAQVLENTKWKVYNPNLTDTVTVEIGVDSIHQYIESDSILVSSLYWEDSFTIKLVDVAGDLGCTNPDTGYYEFSIISDSLYILLLSDDCIPRGVTYDGVVLWRADLPSIIDDGGMEKKVAFVVFPNPALSGSTVYLKSQFDGVIEVFNSLGQVVRDVPNYIGNSTEMLSLQQGMYVVKLSTKERIFTSTLLIQ